MIFYDDLITESAKEESDNLNNINECYIVRSEIFNEATDGTKFYALALYVKDESFGPPLIFRMIARTNRNNAILDFANIWLHFCVGNNKIFYTSHNKSSLNTKVYLYSFTGDPLHDIDNIELISYDTFANICKDNSIEIKSVTDVDRRKEMYNNIIKSVKKQLNRSSLKSKVKFLDKNSNVILHNYLPYTTDPDVWMDYAVEVLVFLSFNIVDNSNECNELLNILDRAFNDTRKPYKYYEIVTLTASSGMINYAAIKCIG